MQYGGYSLNSSASNMNISNFFDLAAGIVGVGIVGRLSYGLFSLLNGKRKADSDLQKVQSEQIDSLYQKDNEQENELKQLRLMVDGKEGKIKYLTEVLTNRSPELEHTLHNVENKIDNLTNLVITFMAQRSNNMNTETTPLNKYPLQTGVYEDKLSPYTITLSKTEGGEQTL